MIYSKKVEDELSMKNIEELKKYYFEHKNEFEKSKKEEKKKRLLNKLKGK